MTLNIFPDEDECIESPCSHYCHNAPGAFACSCPGGYHLKSDARTCEGMWAVILF